MPIKVKKTDKIHYMDHTKLVGRKTFVKFKPGAFVNGVYYPYDQIENWEEVKTWLTLQKKT